MSNEEISTQAPTPIVAPAPVVSAVARNSQRGMTLIEIMVVMAIIGLIGTVIAVSVGGAKEDSDLGAAKILVGTTVANAVEMYQSTRREYPESLETLVEMKRLKKEQLKDPWNQPLNYELTDTSFRVCSNGPDKRAGSNDDICSDAGE